MDYPRTLQEFDDWFTTEEKCRALLERLRWRDGFVCPSCDGREAWLMGRGLFWCQSCRRQTSAIAGTLFERTRKPLRLWFQAMWHVTSQRSGGSALGLQKVLGLGSYQTAWTWLHKMRRAMVRPDRDRLSGDVEVDETIVGGEVRGGKRGRGAERKTIVAIAVEVYTPRGLGRVRMKRIPDASGASLVPFVRSVVAPGSRVLTDAWNGYSGLRAHGYNHLATNISATGDPAHVVMPGVHRVAALLKRWLLGTHQGAASDKHMDYYLDEYVFRFNRRKSGARGLLFYRLLQQAVNVDPVTYRAIVGPAEPEALQELSG